MEINLNKILLALSSYNILTNINENKFPKKVFSRILGILTYIIQRNNL
jgi:hypothetical protein